MVLGSLEDRIAAVGNAHSLLYDSEGAPFVFPINAEFSNWRDEQHAWRHSAIFQDMSFHMCDMLLIGPDAVRLLSDLGVNSFATFGAMQAKQYVICNNEGHYVGDAILTCEEAGAVRIVGKPNVPNWVRFHLEAGKYDAAVVHCDKPTPKLSERQVFRFQVQGPKAERILEELNGGPLPDIGFFKMGIFHVGPHKVTALNHRMSGAPGFEIWGSSNVGAEVKELILAAGAKHSVQRVGARIYPVTATESGWISSAVPAIYTGSSTKSYREWLPANSYEANASMGGSYPRGDMESLYLTPFDMGYGFMVKFDHEFCGRTALEKISRAHNRKKVRLIWDCADVMAIQASMYQPGPKSKYMEMPVANYSTFQLDEVLAGDRRVGMSFHPVYSVESNAWISLASIEEDFSASGQELTVTWGEPNGGSKKPTVERHVQQHVRVVVESKAKRRE